MSIITRWNKILLPEVKYPNVLKYEFIVKTHNFLLKAYVSTLILPTQLWTNHLNYAVWVIQSAKWEWSQQTENLKILGFPSGSVVKNLPAMQEPQETWVQSLSQEDPLEKEMATCFSILTWKIPWTEEPDGLQSMGSQKSQTQLGDYNNITE